MLSAEPPRRFGHVGSWRDIAAIALTVGAFATYFAFRQREIGGPDAWGYYSQAKWLIGGSPIQTGGLDPSIFPALVPIGWNVVGHDLVPFYPPGFPLLLAMADIFGLLPAVPALVGAVTVWLVYLVCKREAGGTVALALAALWAAVPIVVWGATHLMSDLAAAAGVLGAYYLIRNDRPAWGGAVTALSILIRPSNVAFGVVMTVLGVRGRARFRYAAATACGVASVVGVFLHRYQSVERIGYLENILVLRAYLPSQMTFLVHQTAVVAWPFLLLSLVAAFRNPARAAIPFVWFAAFLVPYSMWPFPYDGWWWIRYLLPALPALVDLAAVGAGELGRTVRNVERFAIPCSVVAFAALGFQDYRLGAASSDNFAEWRRRAELVRAKTPPNALVGAGPLGGALQVYAGRATFRPLHPNAIALARFAVAQGVATYLVEVHAEPSKDSAFREWHSNFSLALVTNLSATEYLWRVEALERRQ